MARPSKVDKLPAELRDMIGRLREGGCTIDQILSKLRELDADVGRSGLGDYIKRFDAMRERLHNSRAAAESIMARMEDGGDDRVARLNIATLHASVMELMAGEDGEAVTLDPKSAKLLSETMRNLASASKADQDRIINLKRHLAEETRKKVEAIADEVAGAATPMDPMEVLRRVREDIYGIYER
ncbi:phage protein Gp27 family protein [Aquabacter cavernae]|uniref:phage protein Gp27 family protein n=1 Tax=Aquabacter cavernae TaxID=2496029 RepID=UPI000F8D1F5C|nr:phage protein Gp27 family protein [Aquabacter cavernae]